MADAQVKLAKTVNFGRSLGNRRSNVFYQIIDTLGTGSVSRTNSGVYEVGSNTGIYGAQVSLDQAFSGSILWEVTASNGNVVFASDEVELDNKVVRHLTDGQWQIDASTKEMVFYQKDNTTEFAPQNPKTPLVRQSSINQMVLKSSSKLEQSPLLVTTCRKKLSLRNACSLPCFQTQIRILFSSISLSRPCLLPCSLVSS